MDKKSFTLKNHTEETQLVRRRLLAITVIMLALTSLLIARLFFLQIMDFNRYQTLSDQNQIDWKPLAPLRGLIYDRHGVLLAENIPVFSLEVIPNQIKNLSETLEEIQKIIPLSQKELKQFHKTYRTHRRFEKVPLKLKLTEEEIAKFSVNQYRFPGLVINVKFLRHYPVGESMAHVVGHVGRINNVDLMRLDESNYSVTDYVGKVGIEKFYENELHGKVGYDKVEVDARGKTLRTLEHVPPVKGDNLYLTIDSKLQQAAQEAMENYRGAIVAIKPDTGEVLALVSNPSYDPNIFIGGISSKNYATLQNNQDHPLFNRAIRGLYPIGSTIKPFLALAGLDYGVTTPTETINDPGWYKLPHNKHVFHDWKRIGHGDVNMTKAIAVSCDTYFYDLAHKLGIQHIDEFLTQFGLGQLTQLDMPEEIKGNIPSPAWKRKIHGTPWYEGDTVLTGIGQSYVQITPINLASSVAALAEKGKRYQPHLVYAIANNDKKFPIKPIKAKNVSLKNPDEWNTIINAMEDVIKGTYGTGYRFGRNPTYTVAAKTGTAQIVKLPKRGVKLPERLRDNSIFIGFAPVENPKIALVVFSENNEMASAIARKVMDAYLVKKSKETA